MSNLFLFPQINLSDTVSATVEEAQELTLSYWDLAFKGGWVMVPIVLLSIIAVYIFVERFFVIRKVSGEAVGRKMSGISAFSRPRKCLRTCRLGSVSPTKSGLMSRLMRYWREVVAVITRPTLPAPDK